MHWRCPTTPRHIVFKTIVLIKKISDMLLTVSVYAMLYHAEPTYNIIILNICNSYASL